MSPNCKFFAICGKIEQPLIMLLALRFLIVTYIIGAGKYEAQKIHHVLICILWFWRPLTVKFGPLKRSWLGNSTGVGSRLIGQLSTRYMSKRKAVRIRIFSYWPVNMNFEWPRNLMKQWRVNKYLHNWLQFQIQGPFLQVVFESARSRATINRAFCRRSARYSEARAHASRLNRKRVASKSRCSSASWICAIRFAARFAAILFHWSLRVTTSCWCASRASARSVARRCRSSRRSSTAVLSCSRSAAYLSLLIAFRSLSFSPWARRWLQASRGLMTLQLISVEPVVVLTAIAPFSTIVPSNTSWYRRSFNRLHKSLYVSTNIAGSLPFWMKELAYLGIHDPLQTSRSNSTWGEAMQSYFVWFTAPCFTVPQAITTETPYNVSCNNTILIRHAQQFTYCEYVVPRILYGSHCSAIQHNTELLQNFKALELRGFNTCDVCAEIRSKITQFSFKYDIVL